MTNPAGKRMKCEVCGAEIIVTKGGDGSVEHCTKPMVEKK